MATYYVVCFFLVISTTSVWGWGKEGHMIVAQIASDQLGSTATNIVSQFLGDATLAQIAPLPDSYDHSPEGRWSAPCHYCNLPRDATSFNLSFCPSFCVVKSIINYTSILQSEESDPFQCDYEDTTVEPCALEFLTHYVGDVHQPLHVGYGDDEGGNKVQVEFYNKKANLHEVWDVLMIQRWNSDYQSATQELETMMANNPSQVKQYLSHMDPVYWANESFGYVLTTVYDFSSNEAVPSLGDVYYNRNLPIVKQRLIAAGVRLGQLLNNILVGLKKVF